MNGIGFTKDICGQEIFYRSRFLRRTKSSVVKAMCSSYLYGGDFSEVSVLCKDGLIINGRKFAMSEEELEFHVMAHDAPDPVRVFGKPETEVYIADLPAAYTGHRCWVKRINYMGPVMERGYVCAVYNDDDILVPKRYFLGISGSDLKGYGNWNFCGFCTVPVSRCFASHSDAQKACDREEEKRKKERGRSVIDAIDRMKKEISLLEKEVNNMR